MSTSPSALPGLADDSREVAPATPSATRPLYWSVRRELWENRSIWVAPLVVTAVSLSGFLVSLVSLPDRTRALATLDAAKQHEVASMPYSAVAALLALTALVVGVFYCLDALHGERRDRSILFWKSLPVSDLTTVLSKASIPLVVLPLLVFVLAVAAQLLMLLLSAVVLLASGVGVAATWRHLLFFQHLAALLYLLPVLALWHAPIYAWLLLVSAWARRATFLWAVCPLLAAGAAEWLAFGTWHFALFLRHRVTGALARAFTAPPKDGVVDDLLALFTPGRFLGTPGLWMGLAFAAVCLAAAVRLRRYREPI